MLTIKVEKWTEDEQKIETSGVIMTIINNIPQEQMPRGFQKIKIFSRIQKALDESKKTKEIKLESGEHDFLKDAIEKHLPAVLGMNKDFMKVVNQIMGEK